MNRDRRTLVGILALIPILSVTSARAQQTRVGNDEVEADKTTTTTLRGKPGEDLEIMTQGTFDTDGGIIHLRAANGEFPLLGATQPRDGGFVVIRAGDGTNEMGALDGGRGGDITLHGGSGGDDNMTPGNGGNGGNVILQPGPGGIDIGGGGDPGDPGMVILMSDVGETQLTADSGGVRVWKAFVLPVTGGSPTCDSTQQGSMIVSTVNPVERDSVCICLDITGGDVYSWVELVGNGNCP